MSSYNGLLLVDKPTGPTSHDIVDRVRKALGIRAVGHAGTLDPFASGLLILGLGKGTKALTALVGHDKTYHIQATFGATTDSFDRTGKILQTFPPQASPSPEALEQALASFRGEQDQRAPVFSAIKKGGRKLYELARAGLITEAERPVRRITIHELRLLENDWPTLHLVANVSSGTYIRSLVDDLGRTLGTGAYVSELKRTSVGEFSLTHALDGNHLERAAIEQALIPLP